MNQRHRLIITMLKLADICVMILAYGLSTILIARIQHYSSLAEFLGMRVRIGNFAIAVTGVIALHVAMRACQLYRSRRLSSRRAELLDISKASILCTALVATFGLIFQIRMVTGVFLGAFLVLSVVGLAIERMLLRGVASYMRRHGRDLRYVLILGTNERAREFARRITNDPDSGYRLRGFVDQEWYGVDECRREGFSVVSDFDGLAEYLRHNILDEVAIYLPFRSHFTYFSEVAALCAEHGVRLRFHPDLVGLKTARWKTEDLDGEHYITTYTGVSEMWPQMAKRAIDILGSSAALLMLSPVLIAAAIATKLTSPGPVFFLQERVGLNKRRFKIYKFRTMVVNAEALMASLESKNEAGGPVFKMQDDPRITPIGKLLRRTSIDELPQFINVLKGDMSLVGPRPLPVRDYKGFNEDWQRRRFSVKPGITCLWQVGGRSGITFDQWMRLDLQYLDEWSLWLDVKILLKTVPAVLKGQGAM